MYSTFRAGVNQRRQHVHELSQQGMTITQIADKVGVTRRTVQRHRAAMGIQQTVRRITVEEHLRIEDMLTDGCPVREIARTFGLSADYLYQRYRGRSTATGGSFVAVRQLQQKLGLLLTDRT